MNLPIKPFDDMTKEELLVFVGDIREALLTCEDGGEFCLWLATCLSVDVSVDEVKGT